MIEWGPWQDMPPIPKVGEYIQYEGEGIESGRKFREEGFVSEADDGGFWFAGDARTGEMICVIRWRRASLPEHEKAKEREVENV